MGFRTDAAGGAVRLLVFRELRIDAMREVMREVMLLSKTATSLHRFCVKTALPHWVMDSPKYQFIWIQLSC
jgi:hypothetical protein